MARVGGHLWALGVKRMAPPFWWPVGLGFVFGFALLELEALAMHLEDVDVMGQAVEERAGEALRSEDLGPFIEGQVGGDESCATLVAL